MTHVRLMTYNIRSCLVKGLVHNPQKIVDVIVYYKPDIIALQEVDVRYKFKNGDDQAEWIAGRLEMAYEFHPSISVEEGGYGNAILSRFPMKKIKAEPLPRIQSGMKIAFLENILKVRHEPRSVLWTEVDINGKALQVITTHLGLTQKERLLQMGFLTGEEWLNPAQQNRPIIFCGDLNDTHRSTLYHELIDHFGFQDAQASNQNHRRALTFPSRWPIRCLDHVFFKGPLHMKKCLIPHTDMVKAASDHAPVIVDFRL